LISTARIKLVGFGLVMLVMISMFTAFSAGIVVPSSNVGTRSTSVTANSIKPDACIGFNLSNIVSGAGIVTGTAGNDLILGSPDTDTIDGLGGDDCILGGGGDDVIDGNSGTDICLGGPGLDTFINCEGESQ
jgi:Ca2+-binding RTX toxin-like protein